MGSSGGTFTASGEAGVVTDVSPSNISSFGMCMSPAHPLIMQAQAGTGGMLTPPCTPENVTNWSPAADGSQVDGHPAIDSASTCRCGVAAGDISITSAGG